MTRSKTYRAAATAGLMIIGLFLSPPKLKQIVRPKLRRLPCRPNACSLKSRSGADQFPGGKDWLLTIEAIIQRLNATSVLIATS